MNRLDSKNQGCCNTRGVLKTFGESTSIKGIPKVLKTEQKVLKLIWFLAVLIGFSVATYQVTSLLIRYFSFESVTKLQYCNDCKPPFPDVTVCNLNPLNSLTQFEGQIMPFDDYMNWIDELKDGLDLAQIMVDLGVTIDELEEVYNEAFSVYGYFQNIDPSVIESLVNKSAQMSLIRDCKWYGWDRKEYNKQSCFDRGIYTFYSPEYFVCYTMHLNESFVSLSNTQISSLYALLYLNDFAEKVMRTIQMSLSQNQGRGLRVLVHPPNTLPDMSKGFNVAPGHEVQILLEATEHYHLGQPYSVCTDKEHLDDTEARKTDTDKNLISYVYTDKACISLCHQERNLKDCGCFHPNLPYTKQMEETHADLPKCGSSTEDLDAIYDGISRVHCYLYVIEGSENITCDCPQPCHEYLYDYKLLQTPWPHEIYHKQFYKQVIEAESFAPFKHYFDDYIAVMDQLSTNTSQAFEQLKSMDLIDRNFIQLKVTFQNEGHSTYTSVASVTFDAFFGSLGGILNLWIGITFFTLIELIDLVFKILERLVSTRKSRTLSSSTLVEPFPTTKQAKW